MGETRGTHAGEEKYIQIFVEKYEGKRPLGSPKCI
jgi:hypothetical protein